MKTYQLLGLGNAAAGRNIGAKVAKGDVFYFIDGDMSIHADFLASVWDAEKQDLNEEFVSGHLIDIFGSQTTHRVMSPVYSGGTFLIRSKHWRAVGGMRSRFRTGEEADLSIRLMRKGVHLKRKDSIITDHYTVPNAHESRIWKSLWSKSLFFTRAVMFRHHWFDPNLYKLMWIIDKTFILLVLAIITCFIYLPAGLILLAAYPVAVALRVAAQSNRYMSFIKMIGYFILLDTLNLYHLFTFFPKDLDEQFIEVRRKVMQPQ